MKLKKLSSCSADLSFPRQVCVQERFAVFITELRASVASVMDEYFEDLTQVDGTRAVTRNFSAIFRFTALSLIFSNF